MRRLIASTLMVALACTGCGPLLPRTAVAPPGATGAERTTALRQSAAKFPLGKLVQVTLVSGEKVSGKLRAAGDTGLVVSQAPRTYDAFGNKLSDPTPARTLDLPYDSIQSIKRPAGAGGWALIGLGVFLTWPLFVYGRYPD